MRQVPSMVSCALVLAMASGAGADVVAYWHCNGIDPDVSTTVGANTGTGTMNFASFGDGATMFAGTTVNAPDGMIAGDSLGLTGSSHNNAFVQFDVATAGKGDLSFSFAARRSSTGFVNSRLDAWVNGAWATVGSFNASTVAWETVTFNLASLDSLENGTASLRLVFDGATSGSGTIRFDNVTLNSAIAVPAPGALALLGCAGLVGRRRRKG
ncbi:MAG: hypothetical protein JNM94_18745 [Phycisphaerae bacterium]|nr:hypothetical protein [Phycisphaerae bacterium]